jgi:hypothetical protein
MGFDPLNEPNANFESIFGFVDQLSRGFIEQ